MKLQMINDDSFTAMLKEDSFIASQMLQVPLLQKSLYLALCSSLTVRHGA